MENLIQIIESALSTAGPFIILLGLLIFVHELGHFVVAKLCGVRVLTFSLGFGKKIFQFQRGDTNYCISLIPLGGYVKMFGDEPGAEISEADKSFSFTHKNVWQRIAIVLAGPLMNLFFAAFIFIIVAFSGEEVRSPVIGDVDSSSVAYSEGFRSGDKILSVNNIPVDTWEEFQELISQRNDQIVGIEVLHETEISTPVTIETKPVLRPNPNILSTNDMVGTIDGLSASSRAATVGVLPGSRAEKIGFQTGDEVTKINDTPVSYFRQLEPLLKQASPGPLRIRLLRPDLASGKPQEVELLEDRFVFSGMTALGLDLGEVYIAKVLPNTPASKAELKDNDRILSVGNRPIKQWADVVDSVKSYKGEGELSVVVSRQGKPMTFSIAPQLTTLDNNQGGEEKRYTVGISPWAAMAAPVTQVLKAKSFSQGIQRGLDKTWQVTTMTVVSFLRMIQAKISPKHIGGILSIGQAASESYKIGITHFLMMMGFLSINLFILNLLPIPVLDGGHLLFFVVEAIRGTPLSMRKMEIAQQIGLFLLLSLMVFSLFNDVTRLFGSW